MFHWSPFCVAQPPGTLLWKFPAEGSSGSPAIGFDGTVYFPSRDGNLYAVTPQGSNQWHFATGRPINSSPAVGDDGTIYFTCDDGKLYAVSSDGALKWTWEPIYPTSSSPAVGADGTIYVCAGGSYLVALDSGGTERWRIGIPLGAMTFRNSPAIASDGTVYMAGARILAISPNGSEKWRFPEGEFYGEFYSVAIGGNGDLYCIQEHGGFFGHLFALSKHGVEVWHTNAYRLDWPFQALGLTPAVSHDGTIHAVAQPNAGNTMVAFSSSGSQKWAAGGPPNRYPTTPSPSVDERGGVYFAGSGSSYDPYYQHYALNADGTTNWIVAGGYGPRFISSATLARSGAIYISGWDGLYALAGTNPPPLTGWPMHRQNARQTGKVEWPRMRALHYSPDFVQVEVFADLGWHCTLEVTSNLVHWASATNFVAETNRIVFIERPPADEPQQFYRVIGDTRE